VLEGDDLTTFIVPKVEKFRSLNLPNPHGRSEARSGKALPFFTYTYYIYYIILFNKKREIEEVVSSKNSNFSICRGLHSVIAKFNLRVDSRPRATC
jgi:hypothetical protein